MPVEGILGTQLMPGVFGQAGMEYASHHDGVGFEQFAKVAEKNHAHSTLNPLAQYQKVYSLEEVMGSAMVAYPNTLLMCCPTGDGAAAVVLCSDAKMKTLDPDVRRRAVKISASVLTSDPYVESDTAQPDVSTLTKTAAAAAYEQAGVGPADLDLVELHDCFATAELIHYENLQLCEPGGAGDFIDRRAPWRDGDTPVNVSGGLISKGHPIGATGVANLFEVATHLRGEAGDRQIDGAQRRPHPRHRPGIGVRRARPRARRLLSARGSARRGPRRRSGGRARGHGRPHPGRPRGAGRESRAPRRRTPARRPPLRARRHVAALRRLERRQDLHGGLRGRRSRPRHPALGGRRRPRHPGLARRAGRGQHRARRTPCGWWSPRSAPTGRAPGGRRATWA